MASAHSERLDGKFMINLSSLATRDIHDSNLTLYSIIVYGTR